MTAAAGLFAALPMYDFPHLRAAHAELWRAMAGQLASRGVEAPAELTWDLEPEVGWSDPRLLLGQTCGYPFIKDLQGVVKVVAAPRYLAPGCVGAFHRSAIVVASGSPWASLADLRGARCAVNSTRSNSGMNLLRAEVADLSAGDRFFGQVLVTGSHRASLQAVARGDADVAAIDCVTFDLLRRSGEVGGQVRIIGWTRGSPTLPLVTRQATSVEDLQVLRLSLAAAVADPRLAEARRALLIDGFDVLPDRTYAYVADLERHAQLKGYPELV